jgi:hypothetical protein
MLTPAHCNMIQAPALAALLPKLHMNRHTSRAVIYATDRFGGIGLLDLYMGQGFEQLTLFMGHLKLADENGKLILSLLSHLQLYIGTAQPALSLPFSRYIKWVDMNWLTSIWWFTSSLKIILEVENQWIINTARQ